MLWTGGAAVSPVVKTGSEISKRRASRPRWLPGLPPIGPVLIGLALLHLVQPDRAWAHAPPAIREVRWDAATGAATLLTNRGFILGDADAGYRLLCNQAYSAPSSERIDFVRTGSGALLVATAGGMLRGEAGGCSFTPVAPFENVPVYAMITLTDGNLLAVTGEQPARVFTSADLGQTWQPKATLEPDVFVERVLQAPSAPERLYGDGLDVVLGQTRQLLLTSTDQGATWMRLPVTLLENEGNVSLLDVSPTDPLSLLLKTEDYAATDMDRLLLSTDGGVTFQPLLTTKDITSARFTEDGTGLFVTGFAGYWQSENLGQTLQAHPVAEGISCAFEQDGQVYVCGYYRGFVDGTDGLGRALDGQDGFEPLIEFSQVTAPVDCQPDAPTTMACESLWEDWAREQLPPPAMADAGTTAAPATPAPPVAGGSSPMATTPPATQTPASPPPLAPGDTDDTSSGCSCRLGRPAAVAGKPSPAAPSAIPWLAMAAGLIARRQCRRRSRGAPSQ